MMSVKSALHDVLEGELYDLNGYDEGDQLLKDRVHGRLSHRSEADPHTGCWIFTGAWDGRGAGRVRIGHRPYIISRVAAWIYVHGFELWDARKVFRRPCCSNPACFNPEHLMVASSRTVFRAMLALEGEEERRGGRKPGRRLNFALADKIRQALLGGASAEGLAVAHGVRLAAIVAIGANHSYQRRPCNAN